MKRFFNEKEVTSTLVMDALFTGCKETVDAATSPTEVCSCFCFPQHLSYTGVCVKSPTISICRVAGCITKHMTGIFLPDLFTDMVVHSVFVAAWAAGAGGGGY